MSNKQLHVILALLCAAAFLASPFVILGLGIHGIFCICAIILFSMLAVINLMALLITLYTEKKELGNKIGLGYMLFTIADILFVGVASSYAMLGMVIMMFELGSVGLSKMCYTFLKEERTSLGVFQLSGRIGN